jgi:SAM-dependent methyltransferase
MNESGEFAYPGGELELFAQARNWKAYWSSLLRPYLHGDVLEAGAGIGTNTRILRTNRQQRWVCLEPDHRLLEQLKSGLQREPAEGLCEPFRGTVADLAEGERFDAILYIDVLEHIGDDRSELSRAAKHLKPGGHLVVLSPAHNWLFSRFDTSIGHYRRYTKKTLLAAAPRGLKLKRAIYLDSCGLCASLVNRLVLQQNLPTATQILFWDRRIVPVSRVMDPLLFFKVGKSILAVWSEQEKGKEKGRKRGRFLVLATSAASSSAGDTADCLRSSLSPSPTVARSTSPSSSSPLSLNHFFGGIPGAEEGGVAWRGAEGGRPNF